MTVKEFSDQFDSLLNSYSKLPEFGEASSKGDIVLDEYEKSVFLTKAQRDFVVNFYSGKNEYGYSVEEKELVREALDALVATYSTSTTVSKTPDINDLKHTFTFYEIPANLLWILFEQVIYAANATCPCANGTYAEVIPATHDELHRRLRNPFRGPKLGRVLRLNTEDNVIELISDYPIGSYTARYVKEPQPIILTNLSDGVSINGVSTAQTCALPEITHQYILDNAVRMALQSKLIGMSTESK